MARSVLVVGGGIAGIQAAYDLAEMGVPVAMLESRPSLGGRMAQLDKTFPTNDCSTCILAPKISDCYNHQLVTTYTYSELVDIEGEAGDFKVRIKKKPRYVKPELCNGCGECAEKCPVKVKDPFNEGLDQQKAIYKLYEQGVPNIMTIDGEHCLKITRDRCGLCEKTCDKGAIDYNQKEEIIELDVASVIFAPGYEAFEGGVVGEYGYKKHPNVITSLEYERFLSASGPTGGHVVRPSDGKEAQRIAFLHCAGSRDVRMDHNYCSAVCCMYSIKQAMVTREHLETIEALDLYYMDIRAYGKGFESYYNQAFDTQGINFYRNRVASLDQDRDSGDIIVKSLNEDGQSQEQKYDLVVLSVGLKPQPEIIELMKRLKIRVSKYGFAAMRGEEPLSTSRPGIFACGVAAGPKDIPEAVMEASGAAVMAAEVARTDKLGLPAAEEGEYTFTEFQRPRVGVFVCHCGNNIAGVVKVEEVAEKAKEIPFVEHSEDIRYLCSEDSLELIAQQIKEKGLNRVVVASCTPRTHEPLFRQAAARGGLNPYLMIMANIRDQNSWVHREDEEGATIKALDLVRSATGKAIRARALSRSKVENMDRAVVIGGGVAGLTAALQLARIGFPVILVEKEAELGGQARDMFLTFQERAARNLVKKLTKEAEENANLHIYASSKVRKVEGYVGNYTLTLQSTEEGKDQEVEIQGGTVIVATGAGELITEEYLAGQDQRVISQKDLDVLIRDNRLEPVPQKVFMIQCVGSREEDRQYCSRICCTQAVHNAIYLKERFPEMEITILYRDMRTYGFFEDLYRKARKLGVRFVLYEEEQKPEVRADRDSLKIRYRDLVSRSTVEEEAQLLVLAKAIVPLEGNRELSQQLKVPLNEDGFFLEAHVKLMPVDFATDGVYLCGLAHGPKNISESIAQACAAAGRAAAVLGRDYLLTEAMVATVNEELCSACGTCEEVCPFKAISVEEGADAAQVNTVLCKGCGSCAAVCRSHAADLLGFTNREILDEIDALFWDREPGKVQAGGVAHGKDI